MLITNLILEMMNDKNQIIEKQLLRKLMKQRMWDHKHTNFGNLPKGFPKHLYKEVKKIAKNMIKECILLARITNYGTEVSLNPKMKKRIEKIVFENSL